MSAKNSYKVSRSFADALFSSLKDNKLYIEACSVFLVELSKSNLDNLVRLYQIDRAKFLSLFDEIGEERLQKSIKEFFLNLAENKKLKFLPQISELFRELSDNFSNLQRVLVYLADLKNKNLAEDFLKKNESKDMIIEFIEDKSLISGFKINFVNENKILDISMNGMLSRI